MAGYTVSHAGGSGAIAELADAVMFALTSSEVISGAWFVADGAGTGKQYSDAALAAWRANGSARGAVMRAKGASASKG